jgi:hypothetical protein
MEGADNAAALPSDKVGKITEAMMGAINWSLQHGQVKPGEVLAQAAKKGRTVATIEALRALPVKQLDRLAGAYTNFNRLGATGTGFTAGLPGGLAGFVAIPADIAAVIYFSMRCLSGISQTYSFETESEMGKTIQLLAFAHACRFETLIIGNKRLENFGLAHYLLGKPEHSALARACLLKQFASYLAVDFAKTSWATFLPVVGGVVNGTTNFFFVGDISNRGKVFYHSLLLQIAPQPATPAQLAAPDVITIEVREIKLPLPSGALAVRLTSLDNADELPLVLVLWENSTGEELAEQWLTNKGFATLTPLAIPGPVQLKELVTYLAENQIEDAPENLKSGKPGLLGFGTSATQALALLSEMPQTLGAAVLFNPTGASQKVVTNVPVLLQWGENDPEMDKEWPSQLSPRDSNGLISTTGYAGTGHDFTNPASRDYNPTATKWAKQDTLDWFKRHL